MNKERIYISYFGMLNGQYYKNHDHYAYHMMRTKMLGVKTDNNPIIKYSSKYKAYYVNY